MEKNREKMKWTITQKQKRNKNSRKGKEGDKKAEYRWKGVTAAEVRKKGKERG